MQWFPYNVPTLLPRAPAYSDMRRVNFFGNSIQIDRHTDIHSDRKRDWRMHNADFQRVQLSISSNSLTSCALDD